MKIVKISFRMFKGNNLIFGKTGYGTATLYYKNDEFYIITAAHNLGVNRESLLDINLPSDYDLLPDNPKNEKDRIFIHEENSIEEYNYKILELKKSDIAILKILDYKGSYGSNIPSENFLRGFPNLFTKLYEFSIVCCKEFENGYIIKTKKEEIKKMIEVTRKSKKQKKSLLEIKESLQGMSGSPLFINGNLSGIVSRESDYFLEIDNKEDDTVDIYVSKIDLKILD